MTARRIGVVLALLPLAYVDNPLIRVAGVTDDSPLSYVPTTILVAIAFAYAVYEIANGRVRRASAALDGPVAGLSTIIILAGLLGLLLKNPRIYLLDDLFQMAEFGAFYIVATTLIADSEDVNLLVKAILVLTVLSAMTDFVVAFHSWNPARDGFPRIFPDGVRALPALILPAVVSVILFSGRRQRLLPMSVLLLLGLWTVASLTRGLWLGSVVAVACLVFASGTLADRVRIARRLGIALIAVVALLVPVLLIAQLGAPHLLDYVKFRLAYTPQQVFNPANRIQARRELEGIYIAADLMRSPISLVFGKGLGATYQGDTGYSAATLTFGPRHFIHDSYLAYWFRIGIPGLLAYLFLAWRFVVFGLRSSRASPLPAKAIGLGMVASYVGVLVYSITSDSLLRHPTGMFVAMAMAIAIRSTAKEKSPTLDATVAATEHGRYRLAATIIANSHRDLLSACLRTLSESASRAPCHTDVWVLDNASSDDSATMVAETFPDVRLIRQTTSRGFSANQNHLFAAVNGDADGVLLLNDDVALEPDTLTQLIAVIRSEPSIAAVAPTLVFPDGTFQTAGERLPDTSYHVARHLGIGRFVPARIRAAIGRRTRPGSNSSLVIVEAGYVSAACMLISSAALEAVGRFDDRFNMYSEDADWCKRAADAGWRICVAPSAKATHHRNQSWTVGTAIERERSMYRYLQKHGAGLIELGFLRILVAIAYTLRISALRTAVWLHLRPRDRRYVDQIAMFRGIVAVSLGR